ncbi:MAG TPA: TetR family transcriptional regulator [Pseudomonas sp.]|uniref:DNA-binding transcriptional regulator, AcrR family n=1 Tax=Propionibacterium cyclohexanicum TaxID=64702 RepID=A0A1H9SB55_9ACTN|nr:TetR/AcrR family transcriptional regulator [Propionibacterium cyclohexanicum]SER81603.1 DNA-binding transcriptional regulator, AcrR family [Propionibacterium cyclohexanicum]HCN45248.1 TetR family transcriptional regulator [Pseudomonas sp.]
MDADKAEEIKPCGLRERKKQQTRRAIHGAALRLLDEGGLENATVERICDAADVSARTFFNYYPSKAAAILGLPDRVIPPEVAERFRRAQGELVPALCEVVVAATNHNVDRKGIKRVVAERPELVAEFTRWIMSVREEFIALARERAASESVAFGAASLVLAGFGLALHTHRTDDNPIDVALAQSIDTVIATRNAVLSPLQSPSNQLTEPPGEANAPVNSSVE